MPAIRSFLFDSNYCLQEPQLSSSIILPSAKFGETREDRMTKAAAVFLTTCLVFPAWAADPAIPKELVGIWKLESASFNGEIPSRSDAVVWLVILENGDFIVKAPKAMYGGTVAVNVMASPPAIDFRATLTSNAGKGWTDLGVYEVKDGALTTAKAAQNKERPASVKPRSGSVVQVWRRTEK